jgi:outer membrane receptor protein involved in Fe transport
MSWYPGLLAVGVAAAVSSSLPVAGQPGGNTPQPEIDDVISVTGARRREEAVQDVPIPVSLIDGELITESGAFSSIRRIRATRA